jgi:hypothetical protein
MTKKPVPSLAHVPVAPAAEPSPPSLPAQPARVERGACTSAIPVHTAARVREASYRLRLDKQDITDEARRQWPDKGGF